MSHLKKKVFYAKIKFYKKVKIGLCLQNSYQKGSINSFDGQFHEI